MCRCINVKHLCRYVICHVYVNTDVRSTIRMYEHDLQDIERKIHEITSEIEDLQYSLKKVSYQYQLYVLA